MRRRQMSFDASLVAPHHSQRAGVFNNQNQPVAGWAKSLSNPLILLEHEIDDPWQLLLFGISFPNAIYIHS